MLDCCKDDFEVAYIAAGPLENLIWKRSGEIFKPLDIYVRKHQVFRKALRAVWAREGSQARAVLDQLLKKYNLKYSSL